MAEIPEDLKIMAREIVAIESACIEWGATAERSIELVAERLMEIREAEQMFAKASESTLRERVRELEARYANQENQLLCVGYSGGCDGDLTAQPHETNCPAYAADLILNPHLYANWLKERDNAQ